MIKVGDKVRRKPEFQNNKWHLWCKPYPVDYIFTVTNVGDYNIPGKVAYLNLKGVNVTSNPSEPIRLDYHRFDLVEDAEPVEEI